MIPLPMQFPINFKESQGDYRPLLSPNDQRLITEVQFAKPEDIDWLLTHLKNSQQKMNTLKAYERSTILRKTAEQIKLNAEKLTWLIATEGGKPLADAKVEVARAQNTFEICAEETLRLGGEQIPMERTAAGVGHLTFTTRTPIGPVLAISAFNHPLNLLAHQVGCAIAAGCPVVIKPSPNTPLCAFKLEKYLIAAGLPSECCYVVNAEIPEIEKMVSSLEFSYVSFIGAARIGWSLRKILAPGSRLALEHGGQAPAIVTEDADLAKAIPALLKGSFYHAGQACISTQRIFVHESRYKSFLTQFIEETKKLKTADARDENTQVGPLIRPQEARRVLEWIHEAIQAGAKLECGAEKIELGEQYLTPAILSEVPRDVRLMTEEVFGPVVCVNSYSDEEELIHYLNTNDYIFESCVFTESLTTSMRLTQKLQAMTIVVNNHSAYRVDWMPFGGHKLSGLGMGGVKYSIEEMTRLKQIIIKG